MKVKDLIKKLADFNPDAEVVVNINGDRTSITGIYSWSANDGDTAKRNIPLEKVRTGQVTLKTDSSCSEEEAEDRKMRKTSDVIRDEIRQVIGDECGLIMTAVTGKESLDELYVDSFDLVDLAIALENHFGIVLPDDALTREHVKCVNDIVRTVMDILMPDKVAEDVRQIIIEKCDRADVKFEDKISDLGMDSLDEVELTMTLEERLGIRISDEEIAAKFNTETTVQEVADFIREKLKEN